MCGVDACRCQSTSVDKQQDPKAKRSLLDNASNMLTNLLSGGSLGNMPVAEGAVTDLFGKPLFFSLYDWFLEVRGTSLSSHSHLLRSAFPTTYYTLCSPAF